MLSRRKKNACVFNWMCLCIVQTCMSNWNVVTSSGPYEISLRHIVVSQCSIASQSSSLSLLNQQFGRSIFFVILVNFGKKEKKKHKMVYVVKDVVRIFIRTHFSSYHSFSSSSSPKSTGSDKIGIFLWEKKKWNRWRSAVTVFVGVCVRKM